MSKKTVLRSEMGVVLIETTLFNDEGDTLEVGYTVKVPGIPDVQAFETIASAHGYFEDVVDRLKVTEGDQFELR
jgi:hypothetical protein